MPAASSHSLRPLPPRVRGTLAGTSAQSKQPTEGEQMRKREFVFTRPGSSEVLARVPETQHVERLCSVYLLAKPVKRMDVSQFGYLRAFLEAEYSGEVEGIEVPEPEKVVPDHWDAEAGDVVGTVADLLRGFEVEMVDVDDGNPKPKDDGFEENPTATRGASS